MDIASLQPEHTATSNTGQAPAPAEAAERRELVKAVRAVNDVQLLGERNELTFSVDRETGKAVLRIVNRETREVVQQIPNEEALRLSELLAQFVGQSA